MKQNYIERHAFLSALFNIKNSKRIVQKYKLLAARNGRMKIQMTSSGQGNDRNHGRSRVCMSSVPWPQEGLQDGGDEEEGGGGLSVDSGGAAFVRRLDHGVFVVAPEMAAHSEN